MPALQESIRRLLEVALGGPEADEYPKELAANHQSRKLQVEHFQTFARTLSALAVATDPIAKAAPDGGQSLRRDWEQTMKPGIDRIVALLGTGPHSAPEY